MTIRNNNSSDFLTDLGLSSPSDKVTLTASQLLRLIREEREACAKIAENLYPDSLIYSDSTAKAIRNRWNKK